MIKFTLIPLLVMLSCGSTKTNQSVTKADSIVIVDTKNTIERDSLPGALSGKTGPDFVMPTCIKRKVDSFKTALKHEQPQRVVEYQYKGKKVYYVVMPCCDFFNEVYDAKCNLLGSPDGGFSGRGDGKLPDFFKEATNEKIIWQAAK